MILQKHGSGNNTGSNTMPNDTISFVAKLTEHGVVGFVWILLLAIWGGTASYITKLKNGHIKGSVAELLGEWLISGFAGVMAAFICQAYHLDFYFTAAAAGISGHMGGRGIALIEAFIRKKFHGVSHPIEATQNMEDRAPHRQVMARSNDKH